MASDALLHDLVRRLCIAHHLPGRVRLKLNVELSSAQERAIADARQLIDALGDLPGIRNVNVNLLARSCTVEYDPARIPPAAWEQLVKGLPGQEGDALQAALAAAFADR